VSVWDLLGDVEAAPFSAVLSCELDPGGRVGAHRQEHDPEILVGLEGDGDARVDGEVRALTPGAVVHLPLRSVLEIENRSSDAPLRYLIIKARAAQR
jgi:quercetin dioxygenase-like cupin family protein